MKEKKEKYGISEIKDLIDLYFLGSDVFEGEMKWWEKLLGKPRKVIKMVQESIEAFKDRDDLLDQIKDLSITESREILKYVRLKHGVDGMVLELLECIINIVENAIKANNIRKEFTKVKK